MSFLTGEAQKRVAARKYLYRLWQLSRGIDIMQAKVAELKRQAENVTAAYDKMPGTSGDNTSRVERLVIRMADLEREAGERTAEMIDLRCEILEKISELDDMALRMVLELRYVHFRAWSEIAARLHCSERNIYRFHTRALTEFARVM